MLHAQLRPLLAQFVSATGRGNMILANQTLVRIIETLANSIESRNLAPPADPLVEEPAPEMVWDQPRQEPKRRPVRKAMRRKRPA